VKQGALTPHARDEWLGPLFVRANAVRVFPFDWRAASV
jgi:hypothetical protein